MNKALFHDAVTTVRPGGWAGVRNARPQRAPQEPSLRQGNLVSARPSSTHVRVIGVTLTDDERAYIRRKLLTRFTKFAPAIVRISVRVSDDNGPRAGVDLVCRVKVVLRELPSVVTERRHTLLRAAIDGALRSAAQTVQRRLERRRRTPRRASARAVTHVLNLPGNNDR